MNTKGSESYQTMESIARKIGDVVATLSGDNEVGLEMKNIVLEALEKAYQEGYADAADATIADTQEIVDKHFQSLINKFK